MRFNRFFMNGALSRNVPKKPGYIPQGCVKGLLPVMNLRDEERISGYAPAVIIPGMSSFYTRRGDDGTTGQLGEGRLPKYHPRVEALGSLDEASASLGLARSFCQAAQSAPVLVEVQRDLYTIMAEVAATPKNASRFGGIEPERIKWLESQIDMAAAAAPIPTEFILPGDSQAGAALSLARTIVRRAERRLAELIDKGELENPVLLQYLNRLSSLCFALEILENQQAGKTTILAKK
jgi:cob(I)alamin adenosyltransferase